MFVVDVVFDVELTWGGSDRDSGDGKNICACCCGRGDGVAAGDGVGDRIARADAP